MKPADVTRLEQARQLLGDGQPAAAARVLADLIETHGGRADLHAFQGLALRRAGDPAAAAAAFEIAIALAPAEAEYHVGLGLCRRELGEIDVAETAYRRALALRPGHAIAHFNLGNLLADREGHAEAAEQYAAAVAANPRAIDAWLGLARALDAQTALRDAPAELLAALRRLRPESCSGRVEVLLGFARVGLQLGWWTEARAYAEAASALRPDDPHVRFALALALLACGEDAAAWPWFEARLETDPENGSAAFVDIATPRLRSLAEARGKRVLILPEQGYGDCLQFHRWVPALASNCAELTVLADSTQVSLLQASGSSVASQQEPIPPHDAHCYVMSLPFLLGATRHQPPAPRAYLRAPSAALERWRAWFGNDREPRVGINWAGNPRHAQDAYRSLPQGELAALTAVSGVRFYSLQKYTGDAAAQTQALAALGIVDLNALIDDFGDAAGLMGNLDLVITVDTATAHLAGALGTPLWLLLPSVCDYRWAADGETSAWYPEARIFRQAAPRAWAPIVAEVAAELAAWRDQRVTAAGDTMSRASRASSAPRSVPPQR
jgi:tetratricopeptide (TPR) repeat protein